MTGEPASSEPDLGTRGPDGVTAADRNALELAADVLLYGPVGLAVVARELMPTLAERGRAEVASQVSLARMVGQLVVRQGQDELGRAVEGARVQVGSLLGQLFHAMGDGDDDEDEDVAPPAPPVTIVEPEPAASEAEAAPEVAMLALPDYDSLAASQVTARLAALTPDELEAVRRYESANRARRTVLGRISQIQGQG